MNSSEQCQIIIVILCAKFDKEVHVTKYFFVIHFVIVQIQSEVLGR